MGEVIQVKFGADRAFERVRAAVEEGLQFFGVQHCGDDADLMRLKSERVAKLFRDLSETNVAVRVPPFSIAGLSPEQAEQIDRALRNACEAAVKATQFIVYDHLAAATTDLCTSKLARFPELT